MEGRAIGSEMKWFVDWEEPVLRERGREREGEGGREREGEGGRERERERGREGEGEREGKGEGVTERERFHMFPLHSTTVAIEDWQVTK